MSTIRRQLFWVFDFLVLFVAFAGSAWLAPVLHSFFSAGGILHGAWVTALAPAESSGAFPPLSQYAWVFLVMAPATILCIDVLGGHDSIRRQSFLRVLFFSTVAPLIATGILSEALFLLKTPLYSRLFVFSFALLSGVLVFLSRTAGRGWNAFQLRSGVYADEVAIIATPEMATSIADRIRKEASPYEYKIVGYFDISKSASSASALTRLGHVDDLEEVLIHEAIQRVVMVLPSEGTPWLAGALEACDYFRVAVEILPETLLTSQLEDLIAKASTGPGKLPALAMTPHEWQSDWLFLKRLLDVVVSGAFLLALSPLFLLVAIAIKLTTPDLPVLYPWRVVGFRGRRFTGYKFTTMYADADARKKRLAELNEMSGPVFKIARDPRVTPLGFFLRKFSLNELPQLWSVLKGDMSLVGPRPAFPHELERYEMWQKRKLSAQPGITCFWQVRGRNRISNFDDWVRLDLEYIRTRSFWVDCKILALTAWVVIRGTGT
jgi:exopolysaccharide biosynthesis polyprenyl glycosylphosphotransferase